MQVKGRHTFVSQPVKASDPELYSLAPSRRFRLLSVFAADARTFVLLIPGCMFLFIAVVILQIRQLSATQCRLKTSTQ